MPDYWADHDGQISSRFNQFLPGEIFPRRDLAAGLALVALLIQLAFAQVTLIAVICCLVIGRMSRWRPLWLALPAAAGLGWVLAIGARPALAGYLAGGSLVLRHLSGQGPLLARVRRMPEVAATWPRWLPGQLPLALGAAAAETALIGWLGRRKRNWVYRPGGLVAARNRYLAATLRRGEVATRDGCCVGIDTSSGIRAAITWKEAESGVLCTSSGLAEATATGRDLVLAAIQHRKTVIVIDLAGDTSALVASECLSSGATHEDFADSGAHYDPLSTASPARATNLVMAMVDWTGISHQQQLFCANYLNAALTLIGLTRGSGAQRPVGVLDELPRLLAPGALAAGLSRLKVSRPAAGTLAARVADLTGQQGQGGETIRLVAEQLGKLRSAPAGLPLRAGAGPTGICLARALAERRVVRFQLDADGNAGVMVARLVVADLIGKLAERSDLGGRYDCLTWINGCEVIDAKQLGALVGLGASTGTAVVLGTTVCAVAARIAAQVNVVAVRGLGPGCEDVGQAGQQEMLRGPGRPGVLSLWAGQPEPAHLTDCAVIR